MTATGKVCCYTKKVLSSGNNAPANIQQMALSCMLPTMVNNQAFALFFMFFFILAIALSLLHRFTASDYPL
jgi:hypothetical protein